MTIRENHMGMEKPDNGANFEDMEESTLYLSEEIADDNREKNYIRDNFQEEFEPDFSEEYEE